jgi:TolA-binding protein
MANTIRRINARLLPLALALGLASYGMAQGGDPQQEPPNHGTQDTTDELRKLDRLIQQIKQLENQNRQLMTEIESLRGVLAQTSGSTTRSIETSPQTQADTAQERKPVAADIYLEQDDKKTWGTYTPNQGFKLANTEYGDLSVSIYTYVRYLNQLGLAPTYVDYFGIVKTVQRRQDFQIQKVQIKFLGWLLNPKFRYFL